jgi:cobalt-zinc-cadmium efflux system protein
MLLIGAIVVFYKSIPLLFNPTEVNHNMMIVFAIVGSIVNGIAAYKTSKSHNKNEKAISLHMLEDVLGWISVLVGSIIIKFTGWTIIDPILSIIIALYILYHVYENISEIFCIFMDKVPSDINVNDICKKMEKQFKNVKEVHHIHIWSIDGINNYMTAHVLLKNEINKDEIIQLKKEIKEFLSNSNIEHATLEIEYPNEECSSTEC